MQENATQKAVDQESANVQQGTEQVQHEQSQQQEATVEPSVEQLLEQSRQENAKLNDMYLRAMAEMENTRRRADESIEKAHKFGVEKFAKNMLPVIDSLEKAIEAAGESNDPIIEGVKVTYKQMVQALEMSGMKSINAVGEKFDPNLHQAITMVPATEGMVSGQVAQVFQCGWMIHDRVLRAALVSVVQ